MAHLRVTAPEGFDYAWTKAGVHTAYPYGFEGVVKREVLEAAIKAGKGEDMDAVVLETEPTPRPRRIKIQDDASGGA